MNIFRKISLVHETAFFTDALNGGAFRAEQILCFIHTHAVEVIGKMLLCILVENEWKDRCNSDEIVWQGHRASGPGCNFGRM